MKYKCRLCGVNEVNKAGELCPSCLSKLNLNQPVSTQIKPNDRNGNDDPFSVLYDDTMEDSSQENHKIENDNDINKKTKEISQASKNDGKENRKEQNSKTQEKTKNHYVKGYIKNVSIIKENRNFLLKLFNALCFYCPFNLEEEYISFQLYPDFSGSTLNSYGKAFTQVTVYDNKNTGLFTENSLVEIQGYTRKNGILYATKVKSIGSGVETKLHGAVSSLVVWLCTLFFATAVYYAINAVSMHAAKLIFFLFLAIILIIFCIIVHIKKNAFSFLLKALIILCVVMFLLMIL